MRSFAGTLLLVIFCIPSYCFSQKSSYDVQHYQFNVELSDMSDTIRGKAVITLKLLEPTSEIMLDFSTSKTGKGMQVGHCEMDGNNITPIVKEGNEKLSLSWKDAKPAGSTHIFTIEYQGIPSDGLIISKNMYGHRSFFADNWPNRGHKWLPCVDDPGDKASVEFIVTAPQHYRVVSNGILVKETNLTENKKLTHWKEDVPIASKVMVIGAADFAVDTAGVVQDSIPVYSWVYPENKEKGFYDYGQAKDVLPFFINYVGPYGYKKLANVQSKTIFGGLENANTIFYSENSVTGTRKSEGLLAHEIAHQWFGNMATEKSFAHLWLSEGFATYMTILYMENKYGKDTAVYMLKEDREQVVNSPVTNKRPVVDETTNYMALLNSNSYQKGGWILHMLRRELGDQLFHKAIRDYYAKYAGGNADTRDLQKIFESVSGKDLSAFFDQWLYRPGIPQLEIKWNYSADKKKLILNIQQLQEKEFVFPLQLLLKLDNGKPTIETVPVNQRNQVIEIAVKAPVTAIELDPGTSLLFKGTITAGQ
jgi:aminopeptidase N